MKKHQPFEGLSKHFLFVPNVSPHRKNQPGALSIRSCIHIADALEGYQKYIRSTIVLFNLKSRKMS